MDTLLKDKKVSVSLFIFLLAVSLLTVARIVSEIKAINGNNYSFNTITVEGKGEVMATSDIAVITVNIWKEATTTKEAQSLLNEMITKTLTYLKDQKVADKDIKSEYGGLNPKYSYEKQACYTYPCPPNEPKIVGYTASQTITIKVREIDNANVVRTGLAELGLTDISGPTFSIDNEDNLKDEAKVLAINDARTKAKSLAKQLGVKLGKITNFSDNGGYYPPMYEAKGMSADMTVGASSVTPTLPVGENKIVSNVSITYTIK